MTKDEALEAAILACTDLMRICAEYQDMQTADIAAYAQRALCNRRSHMQVARMEERLGLKKRCAPR